MKYRLIDAEKPRHAVSRFARALGVSRSGYHAWKHRRLSAHSTLIDGNRVVFLYGHPPDSMVKDYCSLYTECRMLNEKVEGAAELTTETKASLAATALWQRGGNELKVVLSRALTDAEVSEIEAQVMRLADEIQRRGLQSHPAGEEEGDDA